MSRVLCVLFLKPRPSPVTEPTIGERIKALRGKRGWSQAELARRMKIRKGQENILSRWERGGSIPNTVNVHRLAVALEVDPKEIVGDEVPPPAPTPKRSKAEAASIVQLWLSYMESFLVQAKEMTEATERSAENLQRSTKQMGRIVARLGDQLKLLREELGDWFDEDVKSPEARAVEKMFSGMRLREMERAVEAYRAFEELTRKDKPQDDDDAAEASG